MAGIFLLGAPLLSSLIGGPVVHAVLSAALGLPPVIVFGVELVLIVGGIIGIRLFPPRGANTGENWGSFMVCLFLIFCGIIGIVISFFTFLYRGFKAA